MLRKRHKSWRLVGLLAGPAVLAGMLAACGEAHSTSCTLPPGNGTGERHKVVSVVDGDTIRLSDRSEVRMVGIQAPKLPLGRKGFVAWPLADEARDAAEEIAGNGRVILWSGGAAMDRHGRRLAHTYVETSAASPVWFQGEMLRRGLARVYTFPDNRACVDDLLNAEAAAREDKLGMWALETYRVMEAGEIARLTAREGSYELVEGRVLEAKIIKGRAYLNFGTDYREDFTVTISPRDMKLFRKGGVNPEAYEGRLVRARGWLRNFNGPSIDATHPAQIEVLE